MNPVCSTFSTPVSSTKLFGELADAHRFFQQPYLSDFQPALDFFMNDASAVEMLKQIESNNEQQKKKISLNVTSKENLASYNYGTHTISAGKKFQKCLLQEQVALLFFELQNALQRQDYQRLYAQASTLGKEHFVEQVETYEHHAALATHEYVLKCVSAGIFTKETSYFIVPLNFNDNYRLQQLTYHAQNIAAQFDNTHPTGMPYRGTWPRPLTKYQIPILKELILNKAIAETPGETENDKQIAQDEIKEFMGEIDQLYKDTPKDPAILFLWENAHEIFKSEVNNDIPKQP